MTKDQVNLKDLLKASKAVLQASLRFNWEPECEFDMATQSLSALIDEIEEEDKRTFLEGNWVVFLGASDDQVRWGGNDDPRIQCIKNTTYAIEAVDIHSFHTKLKLKYIDGWFNSVSFEKVGEVK